TITPVNDAPVATADSYATAEDTPLTVMAATGVLANDTDVDGDPLTAALATAPTKGTLALNANGSFTYTPNATVNGSDTFTYRASDGTLTSNLATVTMTITPVNDAPAATADSYATAEDTPLTVMAATGVLANDTDGPLTSPLATVTITITPVNDAPEATDDSYATAEDTPLTIAAATGVLANDTDVDGDPLPARRASAPTKGTLALNANGSFTYT